MEDEPESGDKEVQIIEQVLRSLKSVSPASRDRILRVIASYFGTPTQPSHAVLSYHPHASTEPDVNPPLATAHPRATFSGDRTPSAKDFLQEKSPGTELDRMLCLAFFLSHYRDTPTFKTVDLSKVNTEAAQRKFSNPAATANVAQNAGLFVPATGGTKQLSALAERYVQALPDREAARSVLSAAKPRKRSARSRRGP